MNATVGNRARVTVFTIAKSARHAAKSSGVTSFVSIHSEEPLRCVDEKSDM